MKSWQHGAYLLVIAALAFVIWCTYRGGTFLGTAETRIQYPMRLYASGGARGERFISFSGTWRTLNGKGFNPRHQFSYQCYEQTHICEQANADIWGDSLILGQGDFPIVSWDDKQLMAKDDNACTEITLIVDLLTQQVTTVEKNLPERDESFCATHGNYPDPLRSELIGVQDVKQ